MWNCASARGSGRLQASGTHVGARYRWAVLAAWTLAQASFSAITVGLAVIAPQLREEFGLSLGKWACSSPPRGSARS
jgi:hypothetical protein